jgi:competence protein ComEA
MANVATCVLLVILVVMPIGVAAAAGKAVDGVVNLNTAAPATLLLLPGIGPAKVERILVYRRRRPFRTIDELVRVKGIGRKMVRALRSHLAVSGPTTATPAVAGDAPALAAPPPPPRPAPPPAARPGAMPTGARPPPHLDSRAARPPPRARASANVPLAARAYCLRPP